MSESLKQRAVKGVAWTAVDQGSYLGLTFVIGVILARLLSPDEFGLLAMIAVFNSVAQAFLDSGFGAALIRKPSSARPTARRPSTSTSPPAWCCSV